MQRFSWLSPKRIAIALGLVALIYGTAIGAGTLLYVTGAMPTGATHNDCEDFRRVIAAERNIPIGDVPQSEIRQRTVTCLAEHELTQREAYVSEYVFWAAWPAVICAVIFLLWPVWSRALINQEKNDEAESGGTHREANA